MDRCAVDTNIFLDQLRRDVKVTQMLPSMFEALLDQGVELCTAPQNIGEFWNVCTRPLIHNGFGLSVAQTADRVAWIESLATVLPENSRVYTAWIKLLRRHEVRGAQVHDAHLAALLEVHGVRHLLTLNGRDFRRYPGLTVVHPDEIAAI